MAPEAWHPALHALTSNPAVISTGRSHFEPRPDSVRAPGDCVSNNADRAVRAMRGARCGSLAVRCRAMRVTAVWLVRLRYRLRFSRGGRSSWPCRRSSCTILHQSAPSCRCRRSGKGWLRGGRGGKQLPNSVELTPWGHPGLHCSLASDWPRTPGSAEAWPRNSCIAAYVHPELNPELKPELMLETSIPTGGTSAADPNPSGHVVVSQTGAPAPETGCDFARPWQLLPAVRSKFLGGSKPIVGGRVPTGDPISVYSSGLCV